MVAWLGVVAGAGCSSVPGVVLVGATQPDAGGDRRDGGTVVPTDSDAGADPQDAGVPDAAPAGPWIGPTCFPTIWNPDIPNPNYEQFNPVIPDHCAGTNHQDIQNVQRVVFLGDSITAGTPPTLPNQLYRARLTAALRERFGDNIAVDDCSRVGARAADFHSGNNAQLERCFPDAVDDRVTLVVMTMGGNDMSEFQQQGQDGATLEQSLAEAGTFLGHMERALQFLKDPVRFPNGSSVLFTTLYEFTDGTGDVNSCLAARLVGLNGLWPDGPTVLIHVNEQLMRLAVQHNADILLLMEHFCGHGFRNDDENARCYRGPDTPRWFDLTCIHPNPTGHAILADMFMGLVEDRRVEGISP